MKNINPKDIKQGFTAAGKSLLCKVPVLKQIIVGYDSYKENAYKRNLGKLLSQLENNVENVIQVFEDDWVKTDDGILFCNKVLDSALDAQLEEKQELFINALINGINNKEIIFLEKLKFVDILRHASLLSLMVLADMQSIFKRPSSGQQIQPERVAENLSNKYAPYSILGAIQELAGYGLFSNVTDWGKISGTDKERSLGYYPDGTIAYTRYTTKFIDFITLKND